MQTIGNQWPIQKNIAHSILQRLQKNNSIFELLKYGFKQVICPFLAKDFFLAGNLVLGKKYFRESNKIRNCLRLVIYLFFKRGKGVLVPGENESNFS